MHKRLLFLLILLILFIFFTCTINETTGLITINNLTLNDVSSINIGDITMCSYIGKCSKSDYWFYNQIAGRLSTSGATKAFMVEEDNGVIETRTLQTSLIFKINYQYNIDIIERENQTWIFIHQGKKSGASYDDKDFYDKPWN